MTNETYDFINQDLNEVKRIFLETIHVYYAKLSNTNVQTQKRSFFSSAIAYFAGETIELNRAIVNANNYGNLNIVCTRNYMTGDKGIERLKKFFEESKNCQTVKEFMDIVADYYHQDKETKFAATLSIAAAKAASVKIMTPTLENPKNTTQINLVTPDLGEFNFVNILQENGNEIIKTGELILKQIKNTLFDTEESFQQMLFRKFPKVYDGDLELQLKCDEARRAEIHYAAVTSTCP